MGKIRWDYIQILKSLATSTKRLGWTTILDEKDRLSVNYELGYDDAHLTMLDRNWDDTPDVIKSKLLIPIMLRRTLATVIDGNPVVEKDYFRDMVIDRSGEIDIDDIAEEIKHRNRLLDEAIGTSPNSKLDRYIMARYLCWTSKVLTDNWKQYGKTDKNWWQGFTLKDAEEFERGRRLVKILRRLKERGKKPIVFAFYTMHQQFAAQVKGNFLRWLTTGAKITGLCQYGIHRHGGKYNERSPDQQPSGQGDVRTNQSR